MSMAKYWSRTWHNSLLRIFVRSFAFNPSLESRKKQTLPPFLFERLFQEDSWECQENVKSEVKKTLFFLFSWINILPFHSPALTIDLFGYISTIFISIHFYLELNWNRNGHDSCIRIQIDLIPVEICLFPTDSFLLSISQSPIHKCTIDSEEWKIQHDDRGTLQLASQRLKFLLMMAYPSVENLKDITKRWREGLKPFNSL